jgi:mannose/fructose/N-acetylgalactosamine-specific phosphotransferase system component IID
VAASYVKLSTGLAFITQDGVNIHVQQMLDGIFPQLLPLVVVLGTWYLMAKRGVSPVKAMLLLLALAAAGVVSGVFAG